MNDFSNVRFLVTSSMEEDDFNNQRQVSTVKWYNRNKGWGFISDPAKPKGANPADIFMHGSELKKLGLDDIEAGTKISFIAKLDGKGRNRATELKIEQ